MNEGPDTSGTEMLTGGPMPVLVRRPEVPANSPHPVLIMLHGWGANEGDIYELVPYVDRRVLVAAPRGPGLVNDNPRGSFSWLTRDSAGQVEPGLIGESVERLGRLIEEIGSLSGVEIDPAQIYMGGFSQGGAMSLQMAAFYPDKLAGILPHSGFFSPEAEQRLRGGVFRGKPAFVAHGTLDMVLQIKLAHRVRQALETGGVDVTYREYQFGHVTSEASRRDLGDWLNDRLRFS